MAPPPPLVRGAPAPSLLRDLSRRFFSDLLFVGGRVLHISVPSKLGGLVVLVRLPSFLPSSALVPPPRVSAPRSLRGAAPRVSTARSGASTRGGPSCPTLVTGRPRRLATFSPPARSTSPEDGHAGAGPSTMSLCDDFPMLRASMPHPQAFTSSWSPTWPSSSSS